MFPMSKRWMMVAAVGRGVLFALAVSGGVRLVSLMIGKPASERVAGNVFLLTSAVAGAAAVYLYSRSLRAAQGEQQP